MLKPFISPKIPFRADRQVRLWFPMMVLLRRKLVRGRALRVYSLTTFCSL